MAQNIIKYNSRLTLKYDTLSNWCPSGTWINFTPLKGEVCIINPAEDLGAGASCLIKVGDGTTKIGELPYLGAIAADVHNWAKAQSVEYNATNSTIDFYNEGVGADGKATHVASHSVSLEPITSLIAQLDTRIDNIGITTSSNSSEATSAIVSITKNNNADTYTAVSKPLPTVASTTVSGNITADTTGYAVIADVTQTTGKIVPTKKYIPKASNSVPGVVKLDVAGQDTAISTKTYADHVSAMNEAINGINTKISNAMHFLGITTTKLSDGDPTATIKINSKDVILKAEDAGAVVLSAAPSSTGIQYEYVWTGSAWAQLGQEGSFAVKGAIVNADVATNAAIAQTKIASSLGKTNLAGDIADLDDRIEPLEVLPSEIANHKSFSTVVAGNTSLVADAINDTLNVAAGTAISVTGNASTDTMTIAHASVTCTPGTSTELTPAHGGTFTIVEGVTVNAQGHVTAYQPRTVKLPAAFDPSGINSSIDAIKSYSSVAADSGSDCVAIQKNEKLTLAGGTKISTAATNSATANSDKITISHASTTRTDNTSTASPAHGGNFTVIDSITSDDTGHITGVNTKTVTLPNVEDVSSDVSVLNNVAWKTTIT